jgi:hypothetical protein
MSRPHRWPRAITFLVLALQAGSILVAAYVWARGGAKGGLSNENVLGLGIAIFVFPPLGILGVAWALVGALKRWEDRRMAATVLVVSIAMSSAILPDFVGRRLGALMYPLVREQVAEASRQARLEYQKEKEIHYNSLVQRFQQPRRVVAVNPAYFLLDDQLVVEIIDFSDFGSWSPSAVIGREVQIVLPDRNTFDRHYVPGAIGGGFPEPRPRDPHTGTHYGTVPAFVVYEGELLNKRFARYPERAEKFFRQHAASPR